MDQQTTLEALRAIWPDMASRFEDARRTGINFVHYTSAQAAMSMVNGKSVWLRNASCMNDYGEIEFGIDKIINFFGRPVSKDFWETIDSCHASLSEEIKRAYDNWRFDLSGRTYMLCLSEHDKKRDFLGRLSMWRAYGGRRGIAIVVNSEPLLRESDVVGAYTFPVFYLDNEGILRIFHGIMERTKLAKKYIAATDRDSVHYFTLWLLQTLSFSLKHPAFAEEKEWRIVYRPNQGRSDHLLEKNVLINGLPQIVYELPLENIPEESFFGISPDELIDTVLIGPTDHPQVIHQSLADALAKAGVRNPEERIEATFIPLRHD